MCPNITPMFVFTRLVLSVVVVRFDLMLGWLWFG
jgi:hypothetical protein